MIMIDEKKINKAARENYPLETDGNTIARYAFNLGAKWAQQEFVKSLWHDVSEEPETRRILVAVRANLVVYDFEFKPNDDWEREFSQYKIERWAYLDDILPKEGGEK